MLGTECIITLPLRFLVTAAWHASSLKSRGFKKGVFKKFKCRVI